MSGWKWMMGRGGFTVASDPQQVRFHAVYNDSGHIACHPTLCLAASVREPNEGDELCRLCAEIVKYNPEGL